MALHILLYMYVPEIQWISIHRIRRWETRKVGQYFCQISESSATTKRFRKLPWSGLIFFCIYNHCAFHVYSINYVAPIILVAITIGMFCFLSTWPDDTKVYTASLWWSFSRLTSGQAQAHPKYIPVLQIRISPFLSSSSTKRKNRSHELQHLKTG